MKRRSVVWSHTALADVLAIARYIAAENPPAARRVAATIRKTAGKLGDAATGRQGRVHGTYEKPLARYPYILAYAIESMKNGRERIVMLHVIHMKRQWEAGRWPEGD